MLHRSLSAALLVAAGCAAPAGGPAPLALQDRPAKRGIAAEVRVYPAGVITSVRGARALRKSDVLHFSAGYNFTDRRDFGEHDDEEGGGPGIGAGWRRYYGPDRGGWMWGARLDLWDLEIDWEDDLPSGGKREGETDVTVLQPTVEGGYTWRLGGGWRLDLTLAVGAEINVDTDGEDVGEGAIGLLGVTLARGL